MAPGPALTLLWVEQGYLKQFYHGGTLLPSGLSSGLKWWALEVQEWEEDGVPAQAPLSACVCPYL